MCVCVEHVCCWESILSCRWAVFSWSSSCLASFSVKAVWGDSKQRKQDNLNQHWINNGNTSPLLIPELLLRCFERANVNERNAKFSKLEGYYYNHKGQLGANMIGLIQTCFKQYAEDNWTSKIRPSVIHAKCHLHYTCFVKNWYILYCFLSDNTHQVSTAHLMVSCPLSLYRASSAWKYSCTLIQVGFRWVRRW